jgi:hypothetical protein
MSGTTKSSECGTLSVRVGDDLTLNVGAWHVSDDEHGDRVAHILPPAVPMFQQIVAYLETKPVPPDGSMKRGDEARAAVAVCLRWGSYFALLDDPWLPSVPGIENERISHIANDEMVRMNIEISAGLAWWFDLCGSDNKRYWELVHRALTHLPVGPKTVYPHQNINVLLACTMPEMSAKLQEVYPPEQLARDLALAGRHGIRAIANTITLFSWRNGPVEDVHAGEYAGYRLGERRISSHAEKAIIRHAQGGLFAGLKAADYLRYDDAWPPSAERVLPFMHPQLAPRDWSYTEESCVVQLSLRYDGHET